MSDNVAPTTLVGGEDTLVLLDIENIYRLANTDRPISLRTMELVTCIVESIRRVVPRLNNATWYASIAMPDTTPAATKLVEPRVQDKLRNYELLAQLMLRSLVGQGVRTVVTQYGPDSADRELLRMFHLHRGKVRRVVLVTEDGDMNGPFGSVVDEAMRDKCKLVLVGYAYTPFPKPLGTYADRYLLMESVRSLAKEIENPQQVSSSCEGADESLPEVVGSEQSSSAQLPPVYQANPFVGVVNSVLRAERFDFKQDDQRFVYEVARHVVAVLRDQPRSDVKTVARAVKEVMPPETNSKDVDLVVNAIAHRTDLFHSMQVIHEGGKFISFLRSKPLIVKDKSACR